ncbi:MAG: S8 family serine peptidase [Candidatus Thermoplasmatota archaeon]|nr:S8 family serine peptidase [Candidatus Thermoplasmatota archaeon]
MRLICSLLLGAILLLIGPISMMGDSSDAEIGFDRTPFGFTLDQWYDGEQTPTDLDGTLLKAFEDAPDVRIEVMVQFEPPFDGEDMNALDSAGLEVIAHMNVLPAVLAKGDRASIERLSRYPGLYWVEENSVMEYQMEKTTTTINATKTWESPVIDAVSKEYPGIDGTGTTVVVVDSGVDAGHPDLDLGEKVIKNYKSDSDLGWREVENSDTSSGHGTHCAGTIAGNGDASGGARRGVAPGAKLIGLSTGEAVSIFNALGGLEWVYENSKPPNRYNIKAVSNSWGPGPGDYNPEDAITKISQMITFENNVVVVFAASNSGGDGSDIQTNPYGNVPSNIAVAAFARDGSGVASFSSRGQSGIITTYPDMGAPGVGIWSTAARRTMISLMTKQSAASLSSIDPYYFAISGTSMATPHISGVVALLFQAYPGLKMSGFYEEAEGEKQTGWNGGQGWKNDSKNKVHEVELILEASARYVQPSDEGTPLAENYIPQNYSIGWNGKPFDLAQGFGLVQVDRAVAIALTLRELRERDFDGDGLPDHPDATVMCALKAFEPVLVSRQRTVPTNRLFTSWSGEWSRFSNQTNQIIPMNHDTSKLVYVPEGSTELELILTYNPWNTDGKSLASLYATIDQDGDGSADWSMDASFLEGYRTATVPVDQSSYGTYWSVNVEGRGIDWDFGERFRETQYKEIKVEFIMSLNISFPPGSHELPEQEPHAQVAYWAPSPGITSADTFMNITEYVFDLRRVVPPEEPEGPGEEGIGLLWLFILLAVASAGGGGYAGYRYYQKRKAGPKA